MDTVLNTSAPIAFHQVDADTQHRRIVQLIDELAGTQDRNVPAALERLTEYVQLHFADEEQFLEEQNYPEDLLQEHRSEHQDLFEQLLQISSGLSEQTDMERLASSIRLIIEGHTSSDQKYVEYYWNLNGI
jgi:hemerythrin-like metal-binding protein